MNLIDEKNWIWGIEETLIFGLLIAVYGVVSKNFVVVILGAIIIMVGWIGSEFIEDALEDWFDWKFQWPGRE